MSEMIKLTARDGATIDAYKAMPAGKPRGGVVVVQEIFGVNPHIRRVADGFAAEGYVAIAPALFDRVKPGIELGYTQEDIAKAMTLLNGIDQTAALLDVEAGVEAARADLASRGGGKVGVVGFCWGGTLAFAAAADLDGVSASVGDYGGGIVKMLDKTPKVPLMLQFGELDTHIPMSDVEAIRAKLPDVPIYTYKADHGFNCDARGSYDKASAVAAMERTLAFFHQHVG